MKINVHGMVVPVGWLAGSCSCSPFSQHLLSSDPVLKVQLSAFISCPLWGAGVHSYRALTGVILIPNSSAVFDPFNKKPVSCNYLQLMLQIITVPTIHVGNRRKLLNGH